MKIFVPLLLSFSILTANVSVGVTFPPLTLKGDNGGNVEGGAWKSTQNLGVAQVLIYADPDEKDKGEPLNKALDTFKKRVGDNKFKTTAVINMAATWKPNVVINQILKIKQKDYPKVTYVKDYKSVLVKKWKLYDDAYNIVLLDKNGVIVLHEIAPLSRTEIKNIVKQLEAIL
jgi:uncharacterized protein